MEKTLTKEIFTSSLFERLRKAVNNAHFIVSGVNECESSMDDLFDKTAKDSSLFSLA